MTNFFDFLLVVFAPPVYLLKCGRWFGALVNGAFYTVALTTVFLFGIGVIPWILCVIHASWEMKRQEMGHAKQRQDEALRRHAVKRQGKLTPLRH